MSYPNPWQRSHQLLTSGQTWANGRPVVDYQPSGVLLGDIQPAPGKEIERLPEGLRTRDVRSLRSRQPVDLPVQQDGTPVAPARIVSASGETFDVLSVQRFDQPGPTLRHWRVLMVRVPELTSGASP